MAITPNAQRHHDALFPDHRSTLRATDPELVEVFDNWAFGEVIEDAPLDVRLRLMVQLAALIASHAVTEYRVMLGAALQVGVTPVEIKEIVYQAVPYTGMARVFDFLNVTNEVFTARGISLPVFGPCEIERKRNFPAPARPVDHGSADTTRPGSGSPEATARCAHRPDVRPIPARSAAHPALPVRQLLR